MSSEYPYQHQPQQPHPQTYQHPQPYPQPHPAPPPYPYGGAPVPPGPQPPATRPNRSNRSKRPKLLLGIGIGLALVLVAGAAALFLLPGDSGPDVALAENPDLEEIAFPDAGSLGYEDGPEAMCASVSEIMLARGYQLLDAEQTNGINCRYGAPGMTLIEDGALDMMADVHLVRGDNARDRYRLFLEDAAGDQQEGGAGGAESGSAGPDAFPVGEEGFITHKSGDRADATAAFRQGDDTFYIAVWGVIVHPRDDTDEPLTPEITYREITDIVKSLAGDASAGEPQIVRPALEQWEGLPELGDPVLPVTGDPTADCAPVTSVAEAYGMARLDSYTCGYEPADGFFASRGPDDPTRHWNITVTDTTAQRNILATEELGRGLQAVLDRLEGNEDITSDPLYELPAGESGYMILSAEEGSSVRGMLNAGYVVGEVYMEISLRAWYEDDRPVPQELLVDDLVAVLSSMSG